MIRSMSVADFKGVQHLESSAVIRNNPNGLVFSTDKPTVIVGPNGSGKSALLCALALRFLADVLGESAFDRDYVDSHKPYWTNRSRYGHDWEFLNGLECDTDNAPAVYYRPNHVPGNEPNTAHALVMGLHEQARAYESLVGRRSAGEGHRNRLERVCAVLRKDTPVQFRYARWSFGEQPKDLTDYRQWHGAMDYKAEVLKKLFSSPGTEPLVLMDEPEQSLDALSTLKLWKELSQPGLCQVIIATHSLYPIEHPEAFSFIETTPGYIGNIRQLI